MASPSASIDDEQLNLSQPQSAIITTTDEAGTDAFYGLAGDGNWITTLAQVPEFLTRTGVSFDELSQLLQLPFVQDAGALGLSPNLDCDISQMTLVGATIAHFARLHRVIRLQRALGWSFADLGHALQAVAPGSDIDNTVLPKLALLERLRGVLALPVQQLCALWSNIGTEGDTPLYDQLFLNRATLPSAAADDPFRLTADRSELEEATTEHLRDHLAAISGALQIDEDELSTLVEDLDGRTPSLFSLDANGDKPWLSLANLSLVHRYAMVARALKLRVSELRSLLALTGDAASPFIVGDVVAAEDFLALVEQIERSGMSLGMLNYVYRHQANAGQNPAPTGRPHRPAAHRPAHCVAGNRRRLPGAGKIQLGGCFLRDREACQRHGHRCSVGECAQPRPDAEGPQDGCHPQQARPHRLVQCAPQCFAAKQPIRRHVRPTDCSAVRDGAGNTNARQCANHG